MDREYNYCAQIEENNFNRLFKKAIREIDKFGVWTNPRGLFCKEVIAPQLILTDPSKCITTLKNRKLNYAYLIIEKFSYLSQISIPETLIAYNSKMRSYLNQETGNFDGAYGLRIAKNKQLEYCYKQLLADKDSRQAVITINDYTDRRESLDKPCTISLQFLMRNGKLDMVVNMRSNDLLWGFCLDVPAFCFLQQVMAYWLGVEVGYYIHQPASFHYYKEFEEKIFGYLKDEELNDETLPEWDIPFENTLDALMKFWEQERQIRETTTFDRTGYETIDAYLDRLFDYWLNKRI